tara:strand:- start:177 stop:584 length:408 start_codon:yes stop_codon:yes gene_type:complete
MSSSDTVDNQVQQKVTKEFRNKVLKWVELDDTVRALRAKTREITKEKKQHEEFILSYLEEVEEKSIAIKDGNLRRSVSKTKAPLKKQIIHKALTELTGDSNKASLMTEHIIKSRPTVERVNLKRTKLRGPRKKKN